jgi:hypothetical protein
VGDHPVKVPTELVKEWMESTCFLDCNGNYHDDLDQRIANKAAQWAADQELEECIKWFDVHIPGYELVADRLRAARRPKPPTLAEQGMEALRSTPCTEQRHYDALFAALTRLAELEANQ